MESQHSYVLGMKPFASKLEVDHIGVAVCIIVPESGDKKRSN
jgi:hypothetical protein